MAVGCPIGPAPAWGNGSGAADHSPVSATSTGPAVGGISGNSRPRWDSAARRISVSIVGVLRDQLEKIAPRQPEQPAEPLRDEGGASAPVGHEKRQLAKEFAVRQRGRLASNHHLERVRGDEVHVGAVLALGHHHLARHGEAAAQPSADGAALDGLELVTLAPGALAVAMTTLWSGGWRC